MMITREVVYAKAVSEYKRLTKHVRGIPKFQVAGVTDSGCSFEMVVDWDGHSGLYEASTLSMSRGGAGAPINGTALRDIRVPEVIQSVLWDDANAVGENGAGYLITRDGLAAGDERLRIQTARDSGRRFRPDERVLELAATLYELAFLTGKQPVKLIQDDFGIQPRTASHWVKLARERGHLEI